MEEENKDNTNNEEVTNEEFTKKVNLNETEEYQKIYLEEKAKLDAKKAIEDEKKKETKNSIKNFILWIISLFLIIIGFLSFLGSFITENINLAETIILSLDMVAVGILELPPVIRKIKSISDNAKSIRSYVAIILIIIFLLIACFVPA